MALGGLSVTVDAPKLSIVLAVVAKLNMTRIGLQYCRYDYLEVELSSRSQLPTDCNWPSESFEMDRAIYRLLWEFTVTTNRDQVSQPLGFISVVCRAFQSPKTQIKRTAPRATMVSVAHNPILISLLSHRAIRVAILSHPQTTIAYVSPMDSRLSNLHYMILVPYYSSQI